jgi:protoheme IX farnesyltransferase
MSRVFPREHPFRAYAELCRLKVSLFAAGSAAAGWLLASSEATLRGLACPAGVLVLACGASALNQFQEREDDARLERTRHRPLPSGSLRPVRALGAALVLIGTGSLLLALTGPLLAAFGAAAVAWYNGVYTRLKKVTPFAAVPGALTGAIPPVMGWMGGGGNPGDGGCLALALLFFMWQVPHFWLVVLDHGEDYLRSGLPNLGDVFSETQIRRVIALWILGTAACSLFIVPLAAAGAPAAGLVLLGASLWLAGSACRFFWRRSTTGASLFRRMNYYIASIFLAAFLGRTLGLLIP